MEDKRINLFILGAPKCGTSAIAEYLNDHGDIFISKIKEPHYFATDIEEYRVVKTFEAYMSLFDDMDAETVVGEASVFYLYSQEAVKNIKAYNPDAKLIIMLRNPVDMIPSLHSQLIYSADEDILNFEDAWFSSNDRKEGKKIAKQTRDVKLLYYDEIAKYAEQVSSVRKYFPDEQIKIIFFDDFVKETQKVYEEILTFLDVDQDGRTVFQKVNANRRPKIMMLNKIIKRIPKPITNLYLKIKDRMNVQNDLGLIAKLNNWNTRPEKRDKLNATMQKEIINNYRDDILALSSLTKRDLSAWLE